MPFWQRDNLVFDILSYAIFWYLSIYPVLISQVHRGDEMVDGQQDDSGADQERGQTSGIEATFARVQHRNWEGKLGHLGKASRLLTRTTVDQQLLCRSSHIRNSFFGSIPQQVPHAKFFGKLMLQSNWWVFFAWFLRIRFHSNARIGWAFTCDLFSPDIQLVSWKKVYWV